MADTRPLPVITREVLEVARMMWERGWVANHEGNVTVRLPSSRYLSTPTSISKGDLTQADLIVLDSGGRVIRGSRRPFSELSMHLEVYRAREDVDAVVHAHPPYATAFALAGRELEGRFTPEFAVSMGPRIPLVPFAVPGSEALLNNLRPLLWDYDCVLLENHGVLCWGSSLNQARLRLEHVELYAQQLFLATQLGPVKSLPDSALRLLADKRRKAGLGPEGRRQKGS